MEPPPHLFRVPLANLWHFPHWQHTIFRPSIGTITKSECTWKLTKAVHLEGEAAEWVEAEAMEVHHRMRVMDWYWWWVVDGKIIWPSGNFKFLRCIDLRLSQFTSSRWSQFYTGFLHLFWSFVIRVVAMYRRNDYLPLPTGDYGHGDWFQNMHHTKLYIMPIRSDHWRLNHLMNNLIPIQTNALHPWPSSVQLEFRHTNVPAD